MKGTTRYSNIYFGKRRQFYTYVALGGSRIRRKETTVYTIKIRMYNRIS